MVLVRRAVIDVGTNSVKLLVADVSGREIKPVSEESKQTRLGQGFYETHQLLPEAISRTAQAVLTFVQQAQANQAQHIRLIATSAARDALNKNELIAAIERATGHRLEVISGDQEADWAFSGVTTDPVYARRPLLLLDVGGGSSEFILGQGEHKHFRQSFRLGTVRLMETIPHSDPPTREEFEETREWVRNFIKDRIVPALTPALEQEKHSPLGATPLTLVGTGGTTTILARLEAWLETYDRATIEATRISFDRVKWHAENLWSMPLAKREGIVGLPRKRADVILTGAVIYEAIMAQFGFRELCVSTRGLRFAAVMDRP